MKKEDVLTARVLNLRAALQQIVDDESGRKRIIAEDALAADDDGVENTKDEA